MKTRLIVMVVVTLLLANQTTVDVKNQPKIVMENDIKNEVIGNENYDEDDEIELEIEENVIAEKQTEKVKKSFASSAPITQEVRQVDSVVDKQVVKEDSIKVVMQDVTEDGSEDSTGVDTTTTQPTSEGNLEYVEGFGYVPCGKPTVCITVDSDGDINKMVGTMD